MSDSSIRPAPVPRPNRDYLKIWGPAVLVTLAGFLLAWRYVEPAPPPLVRIASGSPEGSYYRLAKRYAEIVAAQGVELEVVPTAGSVENLERLQSGDCEVGLAQGGTAAAVPGAKLESLAALYYEPLWLFHRKTVALEHLTGLQGKRVGIGEDGSGTQVLARQLLKDNGISAGAAELVAADAGDAARQLADGRLDAAFSVTAPDTPLIQELLREPGLELFSFQRHRAYEARHRFLSSLTLGEGTIDLVQNVPADETILLAPAAVLVARADLHPAWVPLLLEAAEQVHAEGGLFEEPLRFPSTELIEFPLNQEARRHLESGPSFLNRVLPFWAASMVERLGVLLIPFVTLLIPLFRVAPPLYRWRIRSKIYRWYGGLRELDLKIQENPSAIDTRLELNRLDELEKEFNTVSVPLAYMDEFYHLRMHIGLIRDRLRQLAEAEDSPRTSTTHRGEQAPPRQPVC